MIGYEREGRYFLLFVSVHTMEVSVLDPMDFIIWTKNIIQNTL